jgi:methylenetetrahydrofolate dehydrogenase (NADP+)/methenyltetrahydrofolate cyclohydrolase
MIIDWNKIAQRIYNEIKEEIKSFTIKPTLWVILVWNNPASLRYIEWKRKWAEYVWIKFILARFTNEVSEKELLDKLKEWNESANINGYIIQLPLPEHINTTKILSTIHPKKDVDGFHPNNQWKVLIWDNSGFTPCTPAGLMELLKEQKIDLEWKIVCVVWRSNIVWKPTIALLINAWATVISCNSKTKNLEKFTAQADIVIVAAWSPKLLKVNMVKVGTTVLDVWFTIIDWKIYWDADTKLIDIIWWRITPVPWGVWAITKAMLMKNTLKAYKLQNR